MLCGSSTGRPTTIDARVRAAATMISVPRPTVKMSPCPSVPVLVRSVM
jgi:hypothetical protein